MWDFVEGEVLAFDKPLRWTSFDLVAKVRYNLCRLLGTKKLKVGHSGTLDPLATGVVIVCTGKKTKLIEHLQYDVKEYVATMQLGATTPSYDMEKEVDATYPTAHITRTLIDETIPSFLGEQWQVPPMFSAVQVNGKRAYQLARKGETVELKPKLLVIDAIEVLGFDAEQMQLTIRVVCSKGT
ncbi:MAG: tRNA pseudouridine(55) synthase TruB, partial [Paludibacteraceae bacterium]|nr:tRNA pseudouridine(55) synthase TruB [Paludibacteraceae bacterium]